MKQKKRKEAKKMEQYLTGPGFDIGDLEDLDIDELKQQDPQKANEIKHKKEIDDLKKQRREIDQKIRALKAEGFQEKGIARIQRDEKKETWRLTVLTEYFTKPDWRREIRGEKMIRKDRWNPIMETYTKEEMIQKIDEIISSLSGLKKQISK